MVQPFRDVERLELHENVYTMTMTDKRRTCRACIVAFATTLTVSIGLIVGGFLVPPTGVIDGSVLKAVGELLAFPALAFAMRAIELGYDVRLAHGHTSVTIGDNITEGKADGDVLHD